MADASKTSAALSGEMQGKGIKHSLNPNFEVAGAAKEAHADKTRYSFRDTQSGMANDALKPYAQEMRGLIETKGDVIVDSFSKPKEIEDSVENLPANLDKPLFKENRNYSIAATFDSIRHMVDKKKLTREDVIDYLDRMPDTIIDRDSVFFSHYVDAFNNRLKGLRFKKSFQDGTLIGFNIISRKKMSLNMQTLFLERSDYMKKKFAETLLMHNTSAHTPKAGAGQTSNLKISHPEDGVENSLREITHITEARAFSDSDYLSAVERGDMETAQKMVIDRARLKGYDTSGWDENYDEFIGNENRSYRGVRDKNNPVSDFGHMMFVDNPAKAYWSNNEDNIQNELYSVPLDELTNVNDLMEEIQRKAREDVESGDMEFQYDIDEFGYSGLSVEEFAESFNPVDIVDSADAFDNIRFNRWFYERILEPNGIKGIKTEDGAIVYEGSKIVQRVANMRAVMYDDDGNVIPLSERFNEEEADIRYSIRQGMTEAERYQELKDAEIKIAESAKKTTVLTQADVEDLEFSIKSQAEKILVPLLNKFGVIKNYSNANIDIEFRFSKNGGFAESLHRQRFVGGNYADFGKMLENFDSLVENAIPIEIHKDKYAGTKRENRNLLRTYVLISAYANENYIVPVQFEVKEITNADNGIYVSVALTKIEESAVKGRPVNVNATVETLFTDSNISIRELFKISTRQTVNF